ncbi:MAG: helix-turn-helix domain-containing protein [bacterium]
MEKISIARRRWEQQKPFFSLQTDPAPSRREACMPLPGMESSPAHRELPAPEVQSRSLGSLIREKVSLLQINRHQFMVEIVSGLEKPLKMRISLELADSDQSNQDFLTVEEAARICQVSKDIIYRRLHRGSLQGLKIGRTWRISSNSLTKTAED